MSGNNRSNERARMSASAPSAMPEHEIGTIQHALDQSHQAPETLRDWRQMAADLARETADLIRKELSALSGDDRTEFASDTRLKALLALTKAVQSLEDTINRMERDIEAADRYPHDIVEFREKLEKQIAAIVDEGTEI